MSATTTMAGSPWAKEWRSLAGDSMAAANSQKAILLATFFKTFGAWPVDIPRDAVEKLVAGRGADEILRNRRLRTPAARPQDAVGPVTLGAFTDDAVDAITVDGGDDAPSPAGGIGRPKRKRVDDTQLDVNSVLLAMTEQMRATQSSTQALATAIQQLTSREPQRDRPAQGDNEEDPPTLSGESETLRITVLDLFPAANPKLVAKVITKEFDPFSLWRLWIRKDSLATLEPLSLVTVVNGHVRSRQERDEYKYFKQFDDWANGFIMLVGIMLEVFKLPALAAAQLRFYQEVVEANEIYDLQSVIKFAVQWHHRAKANVLDPSAWWPVIPQWRDNWLRQPKPARARNADSAPQKSNQVCFANWKPGGCRYPNCDRVHVSRELVERKLAATGRPSK